MTVDDLQENRRVCKFPCTSRGEAPPSAGSCVGAGASGGSYSPYKAQKAGRRPPLRSSGGAPRRGALPGRSPGGLRPSPPPAHISPNAAAPAFPGPAPGRQLRGDRGKRRVGAPFTARTRRRKPAAGPRCAAAGGAPAGRPARAKPGRPAAAFSPYTGPPKGEKPYPLAPSSSGCSCSPRRAASSVAPVSESSAQRLVGFFRGSSCPKGTK